VGGLTMRANVVRLLARSCKGAQVFRVGAWAVAPTTNAPLVQRGGTCPQDAREAHIRPIERARAPPGC